MSTEMSYAYPQAHSAAMERVSSSPATMRPKPSQQQEPCKLVQLKVSYTFDEKHEIRCLAKWPHVLKVRTAMTGDVTEIGVVDLGTCIQAVTASSPEIVPGFGQDYAVYTCDHSELGTPLVGHGRLSQIHASSMAGPMSPSNQSTQLVTGLVRGSFGLFNSGSQAADILEVQVRMVPVLSQQKSVISGNSNSYQTPTIPNTPHFEGQHVNDVIRSMSPALVSMIQSARRMPPGNTPSISAGTEELQRLLNGPTLQETRAFQSGPSGYGHATFTDSTDFSRQASPAPSLASVASQSSRHSLSRSHSHQSNYQKKSTANSQQGSVPMDPGYFSNDDRFDDGPSKKRAKLTQTARPSKSSLGKKIDSLRVAASTAASVRVYQPTAIRTTDNPVRTLEEPPRAPTPVPQNTTINQRPRLRATKSNLSEPCLTNTAEHQSPYSEAGNLTSLPNSAATSPDTGRLPSAERSPEELGSSPPVLRETSTFPSSPPLPPFQVHYDSGFMSGNFDMSGDENDEKEFLPISKASHAPQQYSILLERRNSLGPTKATSPSLLFSATSPQFEEGTGSTEASHLNARAAVGLKRSLTWAGEQPTSDIGPGQDPVKKRSFARKEAKKDVAEEFDNEASKGKDNNDDTDKETGAETNDARRRSRSNWNKETRSKKMQEKLANTVAAGVVPSFCDNCGAIETPTWRKAYSRTHTGSPDDVQISKGTGAIIAVQILEQTSDSVTTLFKIFKKNLLPTDKGFSEFLLCNPCGLWLSNRHKMRPEELWKNDISRRKIEEKLDRPKRSSRNRRARGDEEPQSDNLHSQVDTCPSGMSQLPPNLYSEQFDGPADSDYHVEPELPPVLKPRQAHVNAQSQPKASITSASSDFLEAPKAINPSPQDHLGSKKTPINVDAEKADPLRRSLFSSPKTPRTDQADTDTRNMPQDSEALQQNENQTNAAAIIKVSIAGQDGTQAQLTDGDTHRPKTPVQEELNLKLPPVTPTRDVNNSGVPKTPSDFFKTPSNPSDQSSANKRITTSDFFSSAAKAFLHGPATRTPSRVAPATPTQSNLGTVPSLEEMTPFTRNLNNLLSEVFDPQNDPLDFLGNLTHTSYSGQGNRHARETSPTPTKRRSAPRSKSQELNSGLEGLLPHSSPKVFNEYDDPMGEGIWEDIGFGSSPVKDSPSQVIRIEGGAQD